MTPKPTPPRFTAQRIAALALMTAACVVGRMLFTFLPNVQPMTAILLLLTLAFSLPEALLIAALSLVITNLFLGFGIWTVGQLLSYAVILLLFQAGVAALMGFVYGFSYAIFNYFLLGMQVFWAYWLSGLSFDALHAAGNLGFYLLLAPILKGLFQRYPRK